MEPIKMEPIKMDILRCKLEDGDCRLKSKIGITCDAIREDNTYILDMVLYRKVARYSFIALPKADRLSVSTFSAELSCLLRDCLVRKSGLQWSSTLPTLITSSPGAMDVV